MDCTAGESLAVLIDTDLLIEWERDETRSALETLIGSEERAISVVTVSELLHGVYRASGARRNRRRAFVEHVLAGLEPVPITGVVARVHAELWAELERRGDVPGAHDLWISATALAHGYAVATRNERDFSRVRGLRVLVPPSSTL
ncbi:MAG: PIN domain-containing protein [Verrucomicrobiota bacterium]